MPFTSVQTNSFDEPARFFWIDATMKGLPTKGLHAYENGKATMLIKVLGVVNEKRVAALPDAPTIGETVKGLGYTPWYGVFAPAGTPKAVLTQLVAEINRALDAPDVKEKLAGVGCEPNKSSPEAFAAMVRAELPRWAKVVKDSGATID